jgi:hypothetical protein
MAQETISLYLGLKPGERADFEVVGLAAAAFAEAVKEIAYYQDPFTEVRLEFESGVEGSLELKAILKKLGSGEARGFLVGIISTVGAVLIGDIRTYSVGKFLDNYLMPEQRQTLTHEDIERIGKTAHGVREGKIAKAPVQQMYRQLDRDRAIETVGSITKPNTKPIDPVPRSEFQIRAGLAPSVESTPRSRTSVTTDLLTMISPVFLNADRIWRLASALGEHSYHIADLEFLADALNGKFKFKEGVQITAQVETLEVLEGGVWVPKRRTILKVLRRHRPPKQTDLFTPQKKTPRKKDKAATPKPKSPAKPPRKKKSKSR